MDPRTKKEVRTGSTESQSDPSKNMLIQITRDAYEVEIARREFILDSQGRIRSGVLRDGRGTLLGRTQYGFDSYDRINEERSFHPNGRCIRRLLFKYDASSRRLVDKVYMWNKNDPYGPLIESAPTPEDSSPMLPVQRNDKELPGVGLPQFRGDAAPPGPGTQTAAPAKPEKKGVVRLPETRQKVALPLSLPRPVRPVTLLLILMFAAALAGSWAYASYQRHLRGAGVDQLNGTPATQRSAAPADVASLQKDLAFFKDQFERLKRENENLTAAVKKLSDQPAKPTGAPLPVTPASTGTAVFSLDGLVREVEQVRELKFPTPPKFVRVPVTQLERKIRESLERQIPPEQAQRAERTARAIGLTEEPFNYLDAVTGLTLEQSGGYFDVGTGEMLIDEAADFAERGDLKGRLVKEIALALVRVQPGTAGLREFESGNDDRALATRALLVGDAVATKIHYGVVESLNTDYARGQTAIAPVAFAGAPAYLREVFLFPFMLGSTFAQEMSQDGPAALDLVYRRPPQSSAEIQSPELYKRKPPFVPAKVDWGDTTVNGVAPYADNVLGEFGFYLLCKRRLPEAEAFEASHGWAGDRYVCFAGAGKPGDQVFWRTVWRSEKDAAEFFQAAQTVWLHRYGIPFHQRYVQKDGSLVVNDPDRVLRLRRTPDKLGVTIVDATDAAFADAMEARLAMP